MLSTKLIGSTARRALKPEVFLVAVVALGFLWAMTSYKINNWYWQRGDAAVLYQVTDSIAKTGRPISQVFSTTTAFVFDSGLVTLPIDQFPAHTLVSPPSLNNNPLGGHAYLILYPVAILARIIPARPLLLALTALCFVGVVLLGYIEVRRRRVPIVTAVLFCALVVSHPSWWNGLLFGQVYPDRFFILTGLALMFLATRERANRPALIAMAVLCALVDERGALIAGLFLVAYAALYWKAARPERLFRLGVGVALVLYSVFLLKVVLINPIYANQAPSLGAIFALFQRPAFVQMTILMFLVSAPLLILSIFEWRAALIAFLLMLPNVVTNIGGAEKIGWSTHYSSFYFPALVWAAALGCAALYRHAQRVPWLKVVAGVLVALLALSSNMIDPNAFAKPSIAFGNIGTAGFARLKDYVPTFVGSAGAARFRDGEAVAEAVPDSSAVVTTVEQGMPLLYDKPAKLLFFPLGLETADLAVVATYQAPNKPRVFYGAITFLGAAQQVKLNDEVMTRMKKDGYDFAHAIISPALGLAIVKRTRS